MLPDIAALLVAGGWVSWPLVFVSVAMWFVAALRIQNVRRGFAGDVALRVDEARQAGRVEHPHGPVLRYLAAALAALKKPGTCQHQLERFLQVERERVLDYGMLHMGFVTVAPLLGLLGTVNGMIETFASMQGLALTHATEQTVAGGISIALISTQLGLVIGVPGFAAARLLARQEQRRIRELSQAHSVLVQRCEVPR
jgi:biopolymer transport protein ExbB